MNKEINIEIWSDIVCPFCYIGKRNFEKALAQFSEKEHVTVTWKSFQLDPSLLSNLEENPYEYLAKRKGMTLEESIAMHRNVEDAAAKVGLKYDFKNTIVANTFKAHCVLQMAKSKGLGEAAKERLLHAYFEQGMNIGDDAILIQLGEEIGLTKEEVERALSDEYFAAKVNFDIEEALELGISGVPNFVINRKYGISGAQPSDVFLQNLEGIYAKL